MLRSTASASARHRDGRPKQRQRQQRLSANGEGSDDGGQQRHHTTSYDETLDVELKGVERRCGERWATRQGTVGVATATTGEWNE